MAAVYCLFPLAEYKKLHSIIALSGFQVEEADLPKHIIDGQCWL